MPSRCPAPTIATTVGPGSLQYLGSQVAVALVDQDFLYRGEKGRELAHHLVQDALRLQRLDLIGRQGLVAHRRGDEGGHELGLVPEAGARPGPAECRLDFPVAKGVGDAPGLGLLDGGLHLVPGLDAQVLAHAPLEGRQDEVGEEKEALAVLEDFYDIELLPAPALGHGGVASGIDLDANLVRLFFPDRREHFLDAARGDVSGADEDDSLATKLQ